MEQENIKFADVILPLALPKQYTYAIPQELEDQIKVGCRVEVPLRRKHYSGLVSNISSEKPPYNTRIIISVIDNRPIVTEAQLKFWLWLASYYACTIGEVMGVALPSGLKLSSETKISLNPYEEIPPFHKLSNKEYLIIESLSHHESLKIDDIKKLLKQKTVYALIKKMLENRKIILNEEFKDRYKPKIVDFIRFSPDLESNETKIAEAFDVVARSERQTRVLLAMVDETRRTKEVPKSLIYKKAGVDQSVIKALVKKGFIELQQKEISRFQEDEFENESIARPLTEIQKSALDVIRAQFLDKSSILLHGVTGSGKTRIYIECIKDQIDKGAQVLYLVPEIALTTQMLSRIRGEFKHQLGFYHSRMNLHERVELWNKILDGLPIVIGARSSLFLPYKNLKLIIVDEEHDHSYKQQDPNPRYNARDAAIYLAQLTGAKVLLGTATPSLESYHNAQTGKYGYIQIKERFGNAALPEIDIVDMRLARQNKKVKNHFSEHLLEEIEERLTRKEQVMLFQNRRGYAPTLKCHSCAWYSQCPQCDVSLTVHRYYNDLRCHYCGYKAAIPRSCPVCGNIHLSMVGFGTEKVEQALKEIFPAAHIRRMDYDTVRSKDSYEKIIHDMEIAKIDILTGTQMITKGLDFNNITLVGILNADALFNFPDFRASEKAFQLLTQVSGRAGRRDKPGKVLIQTSNPDNPIIKQVIKGNYEGFVKQEFAERKQFVYPPFYRLIYITIKHKDAKIAERAALKFVAIVRPHVGRRILGPSVPYISKIRNMYLQNILIKMEKKPALIAKIKDGVLDARDEIRRSEGYSSVRINIDVDPF